MNLNTTTISAIHASGLSVDSDIYFTTDTAEKKFWRIDNYDISSLDDVETVLINVAGQRFKPFVQDYVNAKWFGAKGDGVTDDTNAIQSAINFAIYYHFGEVLFPSGTYITNTINISSNFDAGGGVIKIRGVGKKATIFKGLTQLPIGATRIEGESQALHPKWYLQKVPIFQVGLLYDHTLFMSFCNLSIIGSYFNGGVYTFENGGGTMWTIPEHYEHIGISLFHVSSFFIEDVEIIGCEICVKGHGALIWNMNNFYLGGYGGNDPNNNSNYGIVLEPDNWPNDLPWPNDNDYPADPYAPNAVTLTNGRIIACLKRAIEYSDGAQLTMRSLDIENNGSIEYDEQGNLIGSLNTGGVFINSGNSDIKKIINVYDCWFESNLGYKFHTLDTNQTLTLNFMGCYFNNDLAFDSTINLGVELNAKMVNIIGTIGRFDAGIKFKINATNCIIIGSDINNLSPYLYTPSLNVMSENNFLKLFS